MNNYLYDNSLKYFNMHFSELSKNEYSDFFSRYINLLGEIDLLDELNLGKERFIKIINSISNNTLYSAYADGKWTLAEVILHCIDTERIFQYRVLRISRNDKTDLSGFNQDDYVPFSGANNRTVVDLLQEYLIVRNSTIYLFKYLTDSDLKRISTIDGNSISVRAMGLIICGHQVHHEQIIKERYL